MIQVNLAALVHAKVGSRETVVLDVRDAVIDELHLAYIQGEIHFTRVVNGVLAEGTIKTSVKTECTRCLEPCFKSIEIEMEDTISLPGTKLTSEHPVRVSENNWADLSPLIREYIWLGLPVNPICSPDCQGLCPNCGGNLNKDKCVCADSEVMDPRWEALRVLLDSPEDH